MKQKHPKISLGNLAALLDETPEAYYWIGFLMADGYFNYKTGQMQLTISIKDKNHMIKFCKFIKSNCSINIQHGLQYASTSLVERTIIDKISKKFDFRFRKTYNPPDKLKIKNNDLFISFMLGYIDGDGCIEKNRMSLQIHCHKSWRACLSRWFARIFELSGAISFNSLIKVPMAHIGGDGAAIIRTRNPQMIYFLKQKGTELKLPVLKRKWDRVVVKTNKYEKAFELKRLIRSGIRNKERVYSIAQRLGIGHQYVYQIKNT